MSGPALTRAAVSATLHCLTGCAIGEVLGMVIGTALGWGDWPTVALAVGLAFVFGYAAHGRAGAAQRADVRGRGEGRPGRRHRLDPGDGDRRQRGVLAVPGAMEAGLDSALFWGSLAFALAVAFVVTVPVNRAMIARGRGHAVVHGMH